MTDENPTVEHAAKGRLPKPKVKGSNPFGSATSTIAPPQVGQKWDIWGPDLWAPVLLLCVAVAMVITAWVGHAYGRQESRTFRALQAYAPAKEDLEESPAERRARLERIAYAIDSATEDRTERAALLSLGWHESRWRRSVCSGESLGDGGRAFGCFQSWEKDRSGGLQGQTRRAIRHLRRSGNYCRAKGGDYLEGAYSLYATGEICDWSGAPERVASLWAAWRRL